MVGTQGIYNVKSIILLILLRAPTKITTFTWNHNSF